MSPTDMPLTVEPALGRPERIRLDGRWFQVRTVLDGWVVRSRWWGQDEERHYLRLDIQSSVDTRVLEAYRVGARWALARILD